MTGNRYARQILALGEEGQAKLAAAHVGIVGLGGLGSQVAQALAYLGVGSFVVVDDDLADETSLNRLIGAVPADADFGALKTVVAERLIRTVNPDAVVQAVPKNLRSHAALDALIGCHVLFGCVDHDAPRLILSELAAAYEITLVDAATEIIPENGALREFGGRMIVARPGDYCVDCAGQLDRERAKWELLSPESREASRRHGYGLGDAAPAPSVVSLNGVIANIAVTEFLMMLTGIREPNRHITYYGLRGNVQNLATLRADGRRHDCYICGYLVGQRERADVHQYALPEETIPASRVDPEATPAAADGSPTEKLHDASGA
jgi:molybdopterin/thiamine biosynthesis adenylyltransferase